MDENFGQSYIDECDDWRTRYNNAIKDDRPIHLTLTGYYAGVPLCGVNKFKAIERGDDFMHVVFAPLDNLDLYFCPECISIWEEE